jgi:hypothetical protein
MAINQSTAVRVFGGATTDSSARSSTNPSDQGVGELLSVGTTARRVKGPKKNGHFGYHARVTSAAGAASAMTVWYSNLPSPDPTADADWVQDTTITSLDMTATGGTFVNVGNVNAEWIRFKAVVAVSTGNFYLYYRAEGSEN